MQLKINGKKVFFTTLGSGKQLLILPGWMHDHKVWENTQNILSRNFQVTVLDFPGFGESEHDPKIKDLSDYSRFLEKVVRELGLHDFILLGQSFGGSVAIKTIALNSYFSVSKLILVDSAGVRGFHLKQLIGFILAKGGRPIFSLPVIRTYAHQAKRLLYGVLREKDYFTAGPLKSVLSRVLKENLEGVLDKIKIPTYIIWGEKDNVTPFDHAKIFNGKIKNSRLTVVKNSTHWPFMEQPDEFCKIVTDFINE